MKTRSVRTMYMRIFEFVSNAVIASEYARSDRRMGHRVPSNHSSRPPHYCGALATYPEVSRGPRSNTSLFSLAPEEVYHTHTHYCGGGGLLPHRFTLTNFAIGGLLSVALSVASRRPAVNRLPALWCPDFPLRSRAAAA